MACHGTLVELGHGKPSGLATKVIKRPLLTSELVESLKHPSQQGHMGFDGNFIGI
jgi:hypothetical protein